APRLGSGGGVARATAAEDVAYVGGGSLPDQAMPTWVVEVEARAVGDAELAYRLRAGDPAVMGRLRDGRLVLDVRTVFAEQEDELVEAGGGGGGGGSPPPGAAGGEGGGGGPAPRRPPRAGGSWA